MMLWENPNKSFGQPNTYYCWDGEVFLCVIRILKVMWKKKKKKEKKKIHVENVTVYRLIQITNSNSYHKQSLKYGGLGAPWRSSG